MIGIIALLISILLPALNKAREQANSIKCLSNLKQIGAGLELYGAVCHNQMPLAFEKYGPTTGTRTYLIGGGRGRTWAGLLRDVGKVNANAFRCPTDFRDFTLDQSENHLLEPSGSAEFNAYDTYRTNDLFVFSYGAWIIGYTIANNPSGYRCPWSFGDTFATSDWQRAIAGYSPAAMGSVVRTQLHNPAELVLVVDTYTPQLLVGGDWDTAIKPVLKNWPLSGTVYTPNIWRHNPNASKSLTNAQKGPNALYADGHAEATINLFALTNRNVMIPPRK